MLEVGGLRTEAKEKASCWGWCNVFEQRNGWSMMRSEGWGWRVMAGGLHAGGLELRRLAGKVVAFWCWGWGLGDGSCSFLSRSVSCVILMKMCRTRP